MSSHAIDLTTHGRELKRLYDAVVSSDPEVTWTVFKYRPKDTVLAPQESSDSDLDEFVAEFDENAEQFGLVQVDVGNVKKVVLVGWLGEGVPNHLRVGFNSHMTSVARYFSGHHIQISARSNSDLTPKIILSRVNHAAGSKYAGSTAGKPAPATKPKFLRASQGANEDDWGDAKPVEERDEPVLSKAPSAYKPTKAEVSEVRSSNKVEGVDSSSSYKPVGKIDIKAIRDSAKGDKFADARVEKIEPSYKPVGKVDLAAIRAEAKRDEERKLKSQGLDASPSQSYTKKESFLPEAKDSGSGSYRPEDGEEFTSLADRMKAFKNQVDAAKPKSSASSSSTGSGRVNGAAAKFGGTKKAPLPSHLSGGGVNTNIPSVSHATEAYKDFGSSSGLTPAQQWAAKHGKYKASVNGPEVVNKGDDEEPSSSDVSSKLSKTSLEPDEPEEVEEDQPKSSFKDLTKRFAAPEADKEPSSAAAPPPPARSSGPTKTEPSGSSDEGLVAIVENEYEEDPAEGNEISLKVGERITHIDQVDENWWVGTNTAGKTGMFPADFVKLESAKSGGETPAPLPSRSHQPVAPKAPEPEPEAEAEPESKNDAPSAIAEYDYDAEDEDELSFKTGDLITNIEFVDENWWTGTFDGNFGMFPKDYVKLKN